MTGRERVRRTLQFKSPDRAPRALWALPGVRKFRQKEHTELLARFPVDFTSPPYTYGSTGRARGNCLTRGTYIDDWGVKWETGEPGVVGEVKEPTLNSKAAISSYRMPWEMLDHADLSQVDGFCSNADLFVKPGMLIRPFERLQFLCGSEQVFLHLGYGEPEFLGLLARLHEFNVREIEMWAKTAVDGISFMDDWGSQRTLLIAPAMWRELFKPLYAEYCRIMHKAGKFIFFHSDGNISSIYPDLIEIGIDAINSQLFCMNIEEIGAKYSGKITFWGEIDRQYLLPFGTPEEVKKGVRRVRSALDKGRGGVIAQCEWGLKDPAANIAAVFEAWNEPLDGSST
ncbi:MAG: methyltransferase [Planctomycetes bacterium]|nr:methyltransferase [Planctomycetota bacterium]